MAAGLIWIFYPNLKYLVNRGTAALKEQSWSRSTERPEICLALVSIGDDDVEHGGSGGHSYPNDSQAMVIDDDGFGFGDDPDDASDETD